MKTVIAALLSAALIYTAHAQAAPALTIEHSVPKVQTARAAVTEKTVPSVQEPSAIVQPEELSPEQNLMQQAGIPREDWNATDYIVSHESSWRPTATNAESGAYGLCQALPASKMATAGDDYMTNPVTQLRWCHSYANSRYGSWWGAFAFWQSSRWW